MYCDSDTRTVEFCLYKNVIHRCRITQIPTHPGDSYSGMVLGFHPDDAYGTWQPHELHPLVDASPCSGTRAGDEVQIYMGQRYGFSIDGSLEAIYDPPDTWVHAIIVQRYGDYYLFIRTKWDVRNGSNGRCYDVCHKSCVRPEW